MAWRQPGPMHAPTMRCIGSVPCWHSVNGVKSMAVAISRMVMVSSTVTRIAMPWTGVPGGMGPRSDISAA